VKEDKKPEAEAPAEPAPAAPAADDKKPDAETSVAPAKDEAKPAADSGEKTEPATSVTATIVQAVSLELTYFFLFHLTDS
jgi:hypothetical protein